MRLWLLTHTSTVHIDLDSDEAVVGLESASILHGHWYAFYWGQDYGGTAEEFVIAALMGVFGTSTIVVQSAVVALWSVSGLLVWRIARRLVRDRWTAAVGAGLGWAVPFSLVLQSVSADGFRALVMLCGLTALLLALRILDGRAGLTEFAGLGLAAGVGWWSSPEIAYFSVPAVMVLIAAARRAGLSRRAWAVRCVAAVAAFGVGAVPWLYDNVASGFPSLNPATFTGSSPLVNPGFGGRLRLFFVDALPLQLDLRRVVTGAWVIGAPGSPVLHELLRDVALATAVLVILVALWWCVRRGGRAWAVVGAVAAFPLVSAADVGSWYYADGRYDVYLGPFLALLVMVAWDGRPAGLRPGRWRRPSVGATGRPTPQTPTRRRPGIGVSVVSVLVLGMGLLAFSRSEDVSPSDLAAGWSRAATVTAGSARALEAAGVHTGYADYWVAYVLDVVSDGRLELAPTTSNVRDPWIESEVAHARRPAWLFVTSRRALAVAEAQFGTTPAIAGWDGITERRFLAVLGRLGIPRTVTAAGLFSVVVPARAVSPSAIVRLAGHA